MMVVVAVQTPTVLLFLGNLELNCWLMLMVILASFHGLLLPLPKAGLLLTWLSSLYY